MSCPGGKLDAVLPISDGLRPWWPPRADTEVLARMSTENDGNEKSAAGNGTSGGQPCQPAEALRESEERFAATFEQAAVGIAHVAPDGRWVRVNQRLCEIVGYTHAELLQRT